MSTVEDSSAYDVTRAYLHWFLPHKNNYIKSTILKKTSGRQTVSTLKEHFDQDQLTIAGKCALTL